MKGLNAAMHIKSADFELLAPYISANPKQVSLQTMLGELLPDSGGRLLDFGCGEGALENWLKTAFANVHYTGVDIASSPEVNQRPATNAYDCYDGSVLPYGDQLFDIVYSNQVLEHVRSPDQSVSEIFRVLKPNGFFIGAVSYLEPYHSFSIFNVTPYGLFRLLSDHGFCVQSITAGPEGTALAVRQLTQRSLTGFAPFYALFRILYWLKILDGRSYHYLKIRYAGHLLFVARRPNL